MKTVNITGKKKEIENPKNKAVTVPLYSSALPALSLMMEVNFSREYE